MFAVTFLRGPTVIPPEGGSAQSVFLDILIRAISSSINPHPHPATTALMGWKQSGYLVLRSLSWE